MPSVGFGTYRITGTDSIKESIHSALRNNYKLIDTAAVYRNESDIAAALKSFESSDQATTTTRSKIFITTKLSPKDHGTEKCRAAIERSLNNLKTDYLDLYLIHWPGVQGVTDLQDPINRELRTQSWKVMEEYYDKGILKSIGVSNYNLSHLMDLIDNCRISPMVNQIEIHPHFHPSMEYLDYCSKHEIHLQAYSSLGTTKASSPREVNLLKDPTIVDISKFLGKTPAQILLKWALQSGFSVLPKSTNKQHIQENIT